MSHVPTLTLEELRARDDQRHHIGQMMLSGEWAGGSSRRKLADRWGCKLARVCELEREAAGAIRLTRSPGWKDEVEVALAELEELIALCRTTIKVVVVDKSPHEYAAPEVGTMHAAIKTKLQVFGALDRTGLGKAPRGRGDEGGEYAQMSHADKRALLVQAMADLDAEARESSH